MKDTVKTLASLSAALSFLFLGSPASAADFSRPSPPITIPAQKALLPGKYVEFTTLKRQILQILPSFSFNAQWRMKLPEIDRTLKRIDSILAKLTKITKTELQSDMNGALGLPSEFQGLMSDMEKFEDEIKKWEEELNTAGDDAQLQNVDLQNMLTKQQQVLQSLSRVGKLLHDIDTAVFRKVG